MSTRRACAVTLGFAACLAFGSCAKPESVDLVLVDACIGDPPAADGDCVPPPCDESGLSFRQTAAFAEIAVFSGGCPTDDDLILGDTGRATFHAVVPATDPLPEIGDLAKEKYGFAAVLRDTNCGVIAMGCTAADLTSIRRINVKVRAWETADHPHANVCAPYEPQQGCLDPLTCVEGRCVGEGGGTTDAQPTGDCDLVAVASGTLPAALVENAQVTGPAIASTNDGFVIAYRQQDPTSGKLQIVTIKLPDSGTLGSATGMDLPGCANKAPTDGIGLAYSGSAGLLAVGLQDCATDGAGAAFIAVDPSGKMSGANQLRNPQFSELKLAQGHSLSARPNVTQDGGAPLPGFDFVFRAIQQGSTLVQIAQLANAGFANSPAAVFTDPADYGMVSTTDKLQALLGRVPARSSDLLKVVSGNLPPPTDGGADGGTGTGEFDLPDSPAWAALIASGDRVAAIAPGTGPGLTLQVANAAGANLGNSKITGSVFQGGDVVFLHEHLLVLGAVSHKLIFYRIDGATTAASVSAAGATQIEIADTVGKASLADFDGVHVAIAGARDHLAVVWLSTLALSKDVPTGGWALLSCKK